MSRSSGLQVQRGPCQLALLLLLLPLLLGPSSVRAISFHLPINSRKCLREEIHKDLLVTGAYEITDQSGGAGGLRTHLKVRLRAGRDGTARPGKNSGRGGERSRREGVGEGGVGPGLPGARRAGGGDRPLPPRAGAGVGGAGPGASAGGNPDMGARPWRMWRPPSRAHLHFGRWRDPYLFGSSVP